MAKILKKKKRLTGDSADGHDLHKSDSKAAKRRAAINLGSKGGKQRVKNLTREQLSEIGRRGGLARHGLKYQP